MEKQIEALSNRICNLEKIISGNGDPNSGMVVQLALVIQKLDTVIDHLDKKKSTELKVTLAVMGSLVAIVIAVIPCLL